MYYGRSAEETMNHSFFDPMLQPSSFVNVVASLEIEICSETDPL
jgi:hypothetical protein